MITLKQKKFVKKYVETGKGTQAALETYNTASSNVAANIASENLRKPKVIEEKNRMLKRKGLSVEQVSESVGEVLRRGVETKVTGDNVLRAAEMVYKLHGAFPAQKSAHLRLDFKEERRRKLENMSIQQLEEENERLTKEIEEIMAA